ncbi:Coenzyme F420 hydrogenase/dehydrogenase, beta subunit C-terminal domain [uncultured Bacteroides sp.]|uniref:Coenzyme F420 hydrogenase/dehydrogenase, beta subunit C-terminal domain n=1 Tax=uncultured Bacteroides sp. TaxID=162156 RepID=UPI00260A1D29|nr:Coenzyme F420 hydrogenase/dehydrogenase, beta subunit C-terminal domain [uncultured Bacteroides sp.]
MINIQDKKDCCGCNACGDVCSHTAISFTSDNEGFWYPVIDKKLCVDCGLCEKICPMLHVEEIKPKEYSYPIKVIGAYHKNITIRFDSTSGGIFSALANSMYKSGGYVSGAIFNEDFTVSNYISNNKRDLSKLRSSKYVQSSAINLYKTIKDLLIKGEKVLACGSPCQMAALRTYLRKDYDNLIIVDFLCRATNSPKVYRKYLDFLEKKYNSKIVYIKAKNKDHGWRSLARKVVFENGQVYYGEGHEDHYRRGYHWNMYERPSCYDCKFKGFPRIADITLGDFWGIEKIDPSLDKNLGTSMVMINTPKGETFFETVKSKLEWKEFKVEDVLPQNRDAILGKIKYPKIDRQAMFEDLDKMDFDEVAKKYFPYCPPRINKKKALQKGLKLLFKTIKSPFDIYRVFKYNICRKNTKSNIIKGAFFNPLSYCALDLHSSANIIITKGIFRFGVKKNKKSKLETRLLLEKNATLQIDGKNFIRNGSDIQVFEGAFLRFGPGATNMGLNIVCADRIWIGDNTRIGRDVWIRDNNGGHSVIQTGYTDKAPVTIGNDVWICSNVNITKGVTIGDGSIIAANSVVTSNIPPHCIASGNPAKVIAENVIWRP